MLSRPDLRYRFPSSTTTWSPFPQGKAYGYRSSLIFGIRYSFYSRAALLTPKALLFSVHCTLRPFPPSYFPFPCAKGVTLFCSLSTVYCHRPLRSPFPFPISLFPNLFPLSLAKRSVSVFNFQLSTFNFQLNPRRPTSSYTFPWSRGRLLCGARFYFSPKPF